MGFFFLKMQGEILCAYLIYCLYNITSAFNLDTSNPVIYRGPESSYFGYSIGVLSTENSSWILIAAPKDNDTFQSNLTQSGTLYQCPFPASKDACTPILVDDTGNSEIRTMFHGRPVAFHHHKEGQWMGMSLDVCPDTNNVLICSPLWSNSLTFRLVDDIYHMNGLCYELMGVLEGRSRSRLIPALTRLDRQVNGRTKLARYSMGSLGFSAKYAKKGVIVLGAPGINDWAGGVFVEEEADNSSKLQYIERPMADKDSYLGYSLATGSFLSRTAISYAAGAPKANQSYGQVLLFDSKSETRPISVINGDQVGSYFGSVLCTFKLDKDGFDDILVGAPLYSPPNVVDEGRVYLYKSRGVMGFLKQNTNLSGSRKPGARFGSAIVNMGDINKDEFSDVAIGAPMEDEGRGVVYVYNGYYGGLWPQFTQRITARSLDVGLRMFGCSLFGGFDIDGNGSNDVLIGAYGSDSAVLLRSRDILDVLHYMEMKPEVIDPEYKCSNGNRMSPCVMIRVCFIASSTGIFPNKILVNYTLFLDAEMPTGAKRVTTEEHLNQNNNRGDSISGSIIIYPFQTICDRHMLLFVTRQTYFDKPVSLQINMATDYQSYFKPNPALNLFNGKYEGLPQPPTFLSWKESTNICRSAMVDQRTSTKMLTADAYEITIATWLQVPKGRQKLDCNHVIIEMFVPSYLALRKIVVAEKDFQSEIQCAQRNHRLNTIHTTCDLSLYFVESETEVLQMTSVFDASNVEIDLGCEITTKLLSKDAKGFAVLDEKESYFCMHCNDSNLIKGYAYPDQMAYTLLPDDSLIGRNVQHSFYVIPEVDCLFRDTRLNFTIYLGFSSEVASLKDITITKGENKSDDNCTLSNSFPNSVYEFVCILPWSSAEKRFYYKINIDFDVFLNRVTKLQKSSRKIETSIIYSTEYASNISVTAVTEIKYRHGHKTFTLTLIWSILCGMVLGLLALVIILIIFYKCGFFDRKYKRLFEEVKTSKTRDPIPSVSTDVPFETGSIQDVWVKKGAYNMFPNDFGSYGYGKESSGLLKL